MSSGRGESYQAEQQVDSFVCVLKPGKITSKLRWLSEAGGKKKLSMCFSVNTKCLSIGWGLMEGNG